MWCDTFKNKENIQLRLDFWQSYILCTETGSPPAAPPPPKKNGTLSLRKKHGKNKVRHLFLLDLFLKFKSLQKTSCSLT